MKIRCPNRINISTNRNPGETSEQHIERIYGMFLPLIKTALTYKMRNKKITIPDYGEPDFYKAFFYHLIHYDLKTKKFNYQRLVTCCLLPSMIINKCDGNCEHLFEKESKTKKKRKTLFCEAHGFVIAFEERKGSFYIYSAYHIDGKEYTKYK